MLDVCSVRPLKLAKQIVRENSNDKKSFEFNVIEKEKKVSKESTEGPITETRESKITMIPTVLSKQVKITTQLNAKPRKLASNRKAYYVLSLLTFFSFSIMLDSKLSLSLGFSLTICFASFNGPTVIVHSTM